MIRLTELCLERPGATIGVALAAVVLFGVGAYRVETVYGYRVLIGDDHPSVVELDRFMGEFGGGLPALVMWDCDLSLGCEHPLDAPSIELSQDLVLTMGEMEEVRDVVAPTNAPIFRSAPGGFSIRYLNELAGVVGDPEGLVAAAYDEKLWAGHLISLDRRAALVAVQPVSDRHPFDQRIVDELLRIKQRWASRGIDLVLGGAMVDAVVGTRELAASQAVLTPVTVVLSWIAISLLTGSIRRSTFALASVGAALVCVLGVVGFAGWPQDSLMEVLPPLVLIVGICDSVHFLSAAANHKSQDARRDALAAAARQVWLPCLITTATTAIAFLSFVASGMDAFIRFGLISAVAVVACLGTTFTLLPALTLLLDDSGLPTRSMRSIGYVAVAMAESSTRRSSLVLAVSGGLALIFAIGWITRLDVAVDWQESFGERSEIVTWDRMLEARFGRSEERLEVEIALPPEERLGSPRTTTVLASIVASLERVDGLLRVRSVLDYVDRLDGLVSTAKEEQRASASELIELIGFGDPNLLSYWVSFDRARVRISATGVSWSSQEVARLLDGASAAVDAALPGDWSYSMTGGIPITRDWVEQVQATQVRSFPMAFGLVWILVSVVLRSGRLGLLAMVPSLLPVVVVLGSMGWLGMTLDITRAMIAAVVIGIGVDDAIHILATYQRCCDGGLRSEDAMIAAISQVGPAVATTSIALAFGFLSLLASSWQSIASFGFFTSLAIAGAAVSSLVVLPAFVSRALGQVS